MTFLSPSLLWFLAATSIPILIHLFNKRRHKTVQWAAMQFLLKATRESRGKKKLRYILILTMRALAIAAFVFAAAKPLISGLLGMSGGSINTIVLVIDRSASMELQLKNGQPSKRETVLLQIRDSMKQLGNPRLVVLDSASQAIIDIPSPDILPELSSVAATDTQADLPALSISALDYASNREGRTEIWIASDLQQSNWKTEEPSWEKFKEQLSFMHRQPAIRVLGLSQSETTNYSLRLLGIKRLPDSIALDLELVRSSADRETTSLPIDLSVNGASSNTLVRITGQTLRFQKKIPIKSAAEIGHGWAKIPTDGNPQDNTVFFAFGPSLPVKSLLVASANKTSDYLKLAAAPPGLHQQSVTRISPSAFATTDLSEISTILWMANFPEKTQLQYLRKFLEEGGQVIAFPIASSSDQEMLGLRWAPLEKAAPGKNFIITHWERNDGPLRNGLDGTSVPVEKLRAIKRMHPISDAATLASWEDGKPFLTRQVIGSGTLWAVASIPNFTWSNLAEADVLLPLIQRIVQQGSRRFDSAYLEEIGTINTDTSKEIRRIDGISDSSHQEKAGVFSINNRIIALNRPLAEDDLEILDRSGLDQALGKNSYTLFDQAGKDSTVALATEMWPYFLTAVLLFLISEALLCLPKRKHPN